MKYFRAGRLLSAFAAVAILLLAGVILVGGRVGLCCLVGVSACMSLMFPAIYGIALADVREDAELGSAGLIMAILGGSVLPAVQAMIIDSGVTALPAEVLSFTVPVVCFCVVLLYGWHHARD
jgi:FHS family L-fucose permease-like MFS transporter